ncbi:MAG: glycosyltransferase [Bacteroidota bacterium]
MSDRILPEYSFTARAYLTAEPTYDSAGRTVTFLTTGLARAGAEIQLVQLAVRLKQRGWGVHVVSMLPPLALEDELADAGVSVDELGMSPGVPDPRSLLRLRSVLQRQRPDVLHTHMVHANLLGRLARLLTRIPVVISTAHNVIEGGRALELGYRATDFLADFTTNVSQRAVDRYVDIKAVPAQKIRTMYNGIDTSRFHPDGELRQATRETLGFDGQFVWIAVGRFEEAKDYPNLIHAFSAVHTEREDARLVIVGAGSLEKQIRTLVAQHNLEQAVDFLGLRDDVPALMNAADGFVMSSAWEGLPMVLLEAGASGLPAVATDVGGNAEIVVHGQTGYIVPPGDSAALSERMCGFMALPEDAREAVSARAREHVSKHFDLNQIVTRWESLYRELLDQAGA